MVFVLIYNSCSYRLPPAKITAPWEKYLNKFNANFQNRITKRSKNGTNKNKNSKFIFFESKLLLTYWRFISVDVLLSWYRFVNSQYQLNKLSYRSDLLMILIFNLTIIYCRLRDIFITFRSFIIELWIKLSIAKLIAKPLSHVKHDN